MKIYGSIFFHIVQQSKSYQKDYCYLDFRLTRFMEFWNFGNKQMLISLIFTIYMQQ